MKFIKIFLFTLLIFLGSNTTSVNGTDGTGSVIITVTPVCPTVITTTSITSITQITAVGGGNVTSNGGTTVTVGGIVWSTSAIPTTGAPTLLTKTIHSNWEDYSTWADNMTGLTPGTLYHVRAYATNSVGTCYGNDVTVTTASIPTISVTASPTTYNTIPNTNVSLTYTPTTSSGNTECRLLNFDNTQEVKPYQASSPIVFTPPITAGSYGYYVQCRNTTNTTVIATSVLITVNVITVSVTASPVVYNVAPGTAVNFTYSSTSTPSGATECLLLNNVLAFLTAYKSASPITYTVPNSIGAYGYYVKCRNTTTTTAMANSSLITVNTACGAGTSWNGSICVGPTGNLTASNCPIPSGGNSCNSNLVWSTSNPIGTSAVTTPTSITVLSANSSAGTPYPVPNPNSSRTFYLYNNGNLLSQATANATCVSGTSWNITKGICEPTTGTLNATGCLIPVGGNSCNTTLTWNTLNPLSGVTSVVKTPTSSGTTVATANGSLGTSYSVPYNSRTFVLVHNGVTLATITPVSACAQKTTWNGSICELDSPKIISFTADPTTIFEGKSTTLTWEADSELATYCTGTGFDTGNLISGNVKVLPTVTTTYTLTCGRAGYPSAAKTATVKVIVLTIKEE